MGKLLILPNKATPEPSAHETSSASKKRSYQEPSCLPPPLTIPVLNSDASDTASVASDTSFAAEEAPALSKSPSSSTLSTSSRSSIAFSAKRPRLLKPAPERTASPVVGMRKGIAFA